MIAQAVAQQHAVSAQNVYKSVCSVNRRSGPRKGANALSPNAAMLPNLDSIPKVDVQPADIAGMVSPAGMQTISSVPQEYLLFGGVAVVLLGLAALVSMNNGKSGEASGSPSVFPTAKPAPKRENAVLVFGATGKTGREVVRKLLASGRSVIAACRSKDRADAVLTKELGLTVGPQAGSSAVLFVEPGVDISNPATLTSDVFKGVTQVVVAVGPVYENVKGSFEIVDGMSPEKVEGEGVINVVNKAVELLPAPAAKGEVLAVPAAAMADWEIKDDVIMGGSSSSKVSVEGDCAVWEGNLVVEGGGFCGIRAKASSIDLSAQDGVMLRVRGGGQIFKLNVKTAGQGDAGDVAYQATFDTVDGEWTTVSIPWNEFVPVKRAKWDPAAPPLDPATITSFGIVLSRFEFNGMPNPSYTKGPFKLEVDGGIKAYSRPRPSVVLMSSGGVERNAIIGDDAEKRAGDIPIVQLNPGSTLNWKYKAEIALRSSGIPYSIIRACGLVVDEPTEPYSLEGSQGDRISGRMNRSDAAEMLTAALGCADAVNKTIEVRRTFDRVVPGGKQTLDDGEKLRIFLRAALDRNRWRVGLNPFPEWLPPASAAPAPAASAPAAKPAEKPSTSTGGTEEEIAARRAEVTEWIARYRSRSASAAAPPAPAAAAPAAPAAAAPAPAATSAEQAAANAEEARAWIAKWRATNGSKPAAAESQMDDVATARAWIAAWRAKEAMRKKETVKAR